MKLDITEYDDNLVNIKDVLEEMNTDIYIIFDRFLCVMWDISYIIKRICKDCCIEGLTDVTNKLDQIYSNLKDFVDRWEE